VRDVVAAVRYHRDMSLMARFCAVFLVALITAPWAAPFSVCDVSTFFDGVPTPASSEHSPRHAAAVGDATAHAVPAVRTAPRVQVMDAVHHPSLWATSSVSSRIVPLPVAVALTNAPLISPLRI
jgi:hypothetical protein